MIEYMPPHARAAYDRLMTSCGNLEATRTRALDTDLQARVGTRNVTAELLARLASSPRASAAMARFADLVASGECSWERVELEASPLPPEVDELKGDPQIDWPAEWPTPNTEDEVESQPYRIPWE